LAWKNHTERGDSKWASEEKRARGSDLSARCNRGREKNKLEEKERQYTRKKPTSDEGNWGIANRRNQKQPTPPNKRTKKDK